MEQFDRYWKTLNRIDWRRSRAMKGRMPPRTFTFRNDLEAFALAVSMMLLSSMIIGFLFWIIGGN